MSVFNVKKKDFVLGDNKPFKSCHASTIVLLPDLSILAAWFGGEEEGAPDVDIWGAHYVNNEWSSPFKLASTDGVPLWNPVLFYDDEQKVLWLFYKEGPNFAKWKTMFKISKDLGDTWSTANELVQDDVGGRGPVRNKPIVLQDGTWLAPASLEIEGWEAFVDRSNDYGQTWEMSNIIPHNIGKDTVGNGTDPEGNQLPPGQGIIQPSLWESSPGNVHMLLRSTDGYIYQSDSEDSGKTWRPAYPTKLPNNNSGIDVTRLDNGWLILAYNPVSGNWVERTPLVLQVSKDNGASWGEKHILEDSSGEYSYPAIVSKDNDIFISYTWNRENIAYWRIGIKDSS